MMKWTFYLPAIFILNTSPQVELGKTLFFDTRLSGNNKMSCATCHDPDKGWSDGLATAIGWNGKVLQRKTPTVAYLENSNLFFWDGRASSLEEQALIPITSKDEMNQNLDELVEELLAVPEYVTLFNEIYPKEGITQRTIAKSIATFERSLSKRNSPFDRWNKGEIFAISDDAKKGYSIMSRLRSNCMFCHKGIDFNDQRLWDTGVNGKDTGRDGLNLFKTPTLRDVALRAPYFHNGTMMTLEDVVRFYMRGGDIHRPGQAPQQRPEIELTDQEVYQVTEFLKTLTTDYSDFKKPVIP